MKNIKFYTISSLQIPAGIVVVASLLWASAGCADDEADPAPVDAALSDARAGDAAADRTGPDVSPHNAFRVAAVQYSSWDFVLADGCFDNICGLSRQIRKAAAAGARLVVTPEYAQNQKAAELAPAVGDTPGTDARWSSTSVVGSLSRLAAELKIFVVFNVQLYLSEGGARSKYNASLAVNGAGKVVARHFKFQLFGKEIGTLTAGKTVDHSFFSTPAGRAGLMICADAQCVVTGMKATADCTTHAIGLLQKYFAAKPALVAFSALWTVGPENPSWAALTIQKKVATQANAWLVGANTTKGNGKGGGVWKPGGAVVKTVSGQVPSIVYADIPLASGG